MRKTGIFGGTFDPIHNMHLSIAKTAMEYLKLDRMILVPTGNPPHKNKSRVTAFSHRFNMVRLAIEDLDRFFVSDIENKTGLKKSYTSDTLDAFHLMNPKDILYFIVGSDSLFDIENWKNPENIFSKARLAVFYRPGFTSFDAFLEKRIQLEDRYNTSIEYISNIEQKLSSSDIRDDLKDGALSAPNIPESVRQYAQEHRLYE